MRAKANWQGMEIPEMEVKIWWQDMSGGKRMSGRRRQARSQEDERENGGRGVPGRSTGPQRYR